MDEKQRRPNGDFAIELGDRNDADGTNTSSSSRLFEDQQQPSQSQSSSSAMHSSPSSALSIANSPLFSIMSYCGSSILMTVTNKYVLNMSFNLNFFLLAVQSIVCILVIATLKSTGTITYRPFHPTEARNWFPISLLLVGMIYTSTKAIQYLSIPVYTIFKNLTIILIAYGEVIWFGGSVTRMSMLSFGLMVLSSVVAAWADISHAISSLGGGELKGEAGEKVSQLSAGYVWMMLNCFCSAAYLLGMRKRIKLTNFKDFDTMYYNNLLSIPTLLISSLLVESWTPANLLHNFPPETRSWIISTMIISGLSSVFISYTSAWCVRVTSSTTYSMVGALNKLPIAISGLVFFDAPVTWASVSAIAMGFASGLIYTVAKLRAAKPGAHGGEAGKGAGLPTTVSASVKSMRDSLK